MDSCQIGHKMIPGSGPANSPLTKIRTVNIKKSHSSTPSPEIIGNKMNNAMSLRSSGGSNVELSSQTCQMNQNEPHMTRSPRLIPSRSSSSPMDGRSEHNIKRRRMNSSPVRPWKSPSPPNNSMGSVIGSSGTNNDSSVNNSPNLLRHISVIRETPPILKPQVMTPSPYHAHHYHHLVDQYAAAYHLYKTGPNGRPISPQNNTANVSPHHAHHWSAYG